MNDTRPDTIAMIQMTWPTQHGRIPHDRECLMSSRTADEVGPAALLADDIECRANELGSMLVLADLQGADLARVVSELQKASEILDTLRVDLLDLGVEGD